MVLFRLAYRVIHFVWVNAPIEVKTKQKIRDKLYKHFKFLKTRKLEGEFQELSKIYPNPTDIIKVSRDEEKSVEQRLGAGGIFAKLVGKAAELEPLITHKGKTVGSNIVIPPLQQIRPVAAINDLHELSDRRTADAVVLIPHCRMSGAARVAGTLAGALAQIYGGDRVIVLLTESIELEYTDWFPKDCRFVLFKSAVGNLPPSSSKNVLVKYLRSLDPKVIFNVNSRLFWDAIEIEGRSLIHDMKVFSYLFCYDVNREGYEVGYPASFFYKTYDVVTGFITDSEFLDQRLKTRYLIDAENEKLQHVPTPVNADIELVNDRADLRRPQVFWAGRFDRQKRVDLLYDIAKLMPDVDFMVWGKAVLKDTSLQQALPSNIKLRGVFNDISDVPLEKCSAWLYTSAWDGVPTILLDIAASGIPVVGTLVGGTREVLVDGLAYGVAGHHGPEQYRKALTEVLHDQESARNRALELAKLVRSERSNEAYVETIRRLITE